MLKKMKISEEGERCRKLGQEAIKRYKTIGPKPPCAISILAPTYPLRKR